MKSIYVIFLISSLILFSCGNESSSSQKESVKVDALIENTNLVDNKPIVEFDVVTFKHLADSLLSTLVNKEMAFSLEVDTLQLAGLNKTELTRLPTGYLVKKSKYCIKYHFDLDSPNKSFRFDIIQAIFDSPNVVDSTFVHMKYLANEDLVSDNGVPGLTYANDYVIRQPLKIYWINTGCTYSIENHNKYSHFLLSSLSEQTVIDSIRCKCGAVNCKN